MRRLSLALLSLSSPLAYAVYAPIPAQEQGTAFTVEATTGISYDSNVLGTHNNEIDSMVFNFAPVIKYNAPLTDRSFLTATYGFSANYYEERPGKNTLVNHFVEGKIAHTFTPNTSGEISNTYRIVDDPETSLNGVTVSTDESYDQNLFNASLNHDWSHLWSTTVKYRNSDFAYDNSALATDLDRNEHLLGLQTNYYLNEKTVLVSEYRYMDINYDDNSITNKDSQSHFFIAGADYQLNPLFQIKGRGGIEHRDRKDGGADDDTSFYGELTGLYAYGQQSYASLGIRYDIQQTSDPINFSDEETFSVVGNIQHAIRPTLFAGLNIRYEDATLLARAPGANDTTDERLRLGTSLTWLPTPRWAVTLSYDYDEVTSDTFTREEERHRIGLSARYSFGFDLR